MSNKGPERFDGVLLGKIKYLYIDNNNKEAAEIQFRRNHNEHIILYLFQAWLRIAREAFRKCWT